MHLANNLFGEQTRLAGDTDQDIRFHIAHNVKQGEHFVGGIPLLQIFTLLHQFVLERQQVRHGVSQQAETVNHEHALTRFFFA